jgi:glycerophosphoryl diester phosphodiesterase
VWVQSFEEANLRALRAATPLRLLRLVDVSEPALLSADGLRAIAAYAHGVGAPKKLLVDDEGRDTGAVARIHAAGLEVHVWTFRDEARFLRPWAGGDPRVELRRFADLGADAVFCDYPDTGAAALR